MCSVRGFILSHPVYCWFLFGFYGHVNSSIWSHYTMSTPNKSDA